MVSIAAIIVKEPKTLEASFINFILSMAAEFIITLSAPALSILSTSFKDLIPPPTDKGINKF